ncbi:hypothetical protein [Methylomicrobium sp. Wu6]|uniref:hypothetical protein n=1 Tax=Methylomicrobium sp. Wu6 TaxID=3107928 RepID=UPI002DD68960|nr:hypothetical protein [Methylomicrobium sp. Wu6]MEC4749098.1 hypothetical protein [Methylomicrobium sp. Wu6]
MGKIKLPTLCKILISLLLWVPPYGWGQDAIIVSAPAGEYTLSIEADEEWHTLRLRALHPRYQPCNVDLEAVLSILASAFAKTEPPTLRGEYTSLFIGRLIDYPWLSHFLADTAYRDKRWNKKKGRPIKMDINTYAARALYNQNVLKPIQTELARHSYRIVGVSVEKVLVGGFRDLPKPKRKRLDGRIPFDAQVWFRLLKH